jgi:hypothetical protein
MSPKAASSSGCIGFIQGEGAKRPASSRPSARIPRLIPVDVSSGDTRSRFAVEPMFRVTITPSKRTNTDHPGTPPRNTPKHTEMAQQTPHAPVKAVLPAASGRPHRGLERTQENTLVPVACLESTHSPHTSATQLTHGRPWWRLSDRPLPVRPHSPLPLADHTGELSEPRRIRWCRLLAANPLTACTLLNPGRS